MASRELLFERWTRTARVACILAIAVTGAVRRVRQGSGQVLRGRRWICSQDLRKHHEHRGCACPFGDLQTHPWALAADREILARCVGEEAREGQL